MLIIWGEKDVERSRGLVAERCPVCDRVATVRVSHVYRKSHVYYIALGRGQLVASVLRCQDCRGKTTCQPLDYPRYLTKAEARDLTLGDIIEQTNPRLPVVLAVLAEQGRFVDEPEGRP